MFLTIPARSRPQTLSDRCIDDISELNQALGINDVEPGLSERGPLRPDRLSPVRDRLCGRTLSAGFQTLDQVVIVASTLMIVIQSDAGQLLTVADWLPVLAGAVTSTYGLKVLGAHSFPLKERFSFHMLRVTGAVALGSVAARLTAMASGNVGSIAGVWTLIVLAGLLLSHAWAFGFVATARKAGRLTPNIVIVGATDNARALIQQALTVRHVSILGIFDDRIDRVGSKLDGVPLLGRLRDLPDHRVLPFVDRVVIALPPSAEARVKDVVDQLKLIPNALTLYVAMQEDAAAAALVRLANCPLAEQGVAEQDNSGTLTKRAFDVVVSGAALLALAPLLLMIGLAVRLSSPGPALFKQLRHGFNNEPITVLKFRSMRTECSDAKAVRQVSANDDRVTPVGRFIRKSSLDELPQLLNVLIGEMSLVGPRPHAIGMKTGDTESARLVAEYAWRHRMKPGITGWAQINGSRGPVDTEAAVRERVTLDIEYIERQNFWLDLYIILVTVPRLLGDKHAVR